MDPNLLDRMLDGYHAERTAVTITLQNRVRITGRIRAFDSYVILMDNAKNDILFRHAISSLSQAQAEERKQNAQAAPAAPSRPAALRPAKSAPRNPRPGNSNNAKHAPAAEKEGISNTMKDGLQRWMQMQKADRK